jgi:hypothetical protein
LRAASVPLQIEAGNASFTIGRVGEFFAENSLIDLRIGYCQTLIRAALLCIQSKFRSLQKNPDYLSPKNPGWSAMRK